MINTVEIEEGHFEGSAEIIVSCDEPAGTDVVLYKFVNGVDTQIGAATMANGVGAGFSRIELTANIAKGDIIVGYIDEFGKQGGKPVIVYEATTGIKTGWRNPDIIQIGSTEQDYSNYIAAGGKEIADIYAPESTINNTVQRIGDKSAQIIDFILEQTYTTAEIEEEIVNVCVVTVKGFNNAIGNPSISWNGGALEQTYQKTFVSSQNGDYELTVVPENGVFQEKTIEFTINIVDTELDPVVSDIWAASYEVNPVANRSVGLNAYSYYPLECRILVTGSETFAAMTSNTGSRWGQAPILNVPTGTYVGEIRLTGTTQVRTVDVRVTF